MLFQTYIVACLLQLCSTAAAPSNAQHPLQSQASKSVQEVRAELKKAEIIPTVIDDFLPSLTLSVTWKKGHAKLGNTLKPKRLKKAPGITLHDITAPENDAASTTITSSQMTYVVTLTDPDAPSRDNPVWSEFCHWIAANVSLSENAYSSLPQPEFDRLVKHDTSGLNSVMAYKPPTPPKKTGKHRYVFLVFAPKNGTTEALHLSAPSERRHWGTGRVRGGVREWAGHNGLVPVAANFVYAQNKKQ